MAIWDSFTGSSAKDVQEQAWRNTKVMMKNRHQWEAQDLENAGLNRILGYTKGGPPLGPSPAPVEPVGRLGRDIGSIIDAGKGIATAKAAIGTAKSGAAIAKEGETTAMHGAKTAEYVRDRAQMDSFSAAALSTTHAQEAEQSVIATAKAGLSLNKAIKESGFHGSAYAKALQYVEQTVGAVSGLGSLMYPLGQALKKPTQILNKKNTTIRNQKIIHGNEPRR